MQRDDKTPLSTPPEPLSLAGVQSTLTAAAAAAASSLLSIAASYFNPAPVTSGASPVSPAPAASDATLAPAKKQPRKTKDFSANVTAAIALPDVPPKPNTTPPSWVSSLTAVATSLFTQTNKPAATPLPVSTGPSIRTMIKDLHTSCTAVLNDNMTDTQKSELDRCTLKKIHLLEDQIKEHAARRVDSLFYAAVAVYNTNAVISDGQTVKQHGIGSREHGTQACHSTLFSNLQLANSHATSTWLWSSFSSLMTLEGTHLMETFNMTVELPAEVNEFDKHLEGLYGRSAHVNHMLVILNRVSKGEINPQQGMTEFLRIMDFFFEDFRLKYLFNENDVNKPKATKETEKIRSQLQTYQHIWELQREGSFKAAVQGNTIKEVDPNYIYSMLRVNTFAQRHFHLLDTHFLAMQHEIARSTTSCYTISDPTDALKSRLAQ